LPVNPRRGARVVAVADKDKAKAERLAAALRENLKRRKAHARVRADTSKSPTNC